MSKTHTPVEDRLDHLYFKAMRCPYCHTKIPAGTAQCENCGLTKEQIFHAHTIQNHRQEKHRILYSKVRPAQLPFWQMAVGGLFGFLGIHCFLAKRYWRGILILSCTILFVLSCLIFNTTYTNYLGEIIEAHPWRAMFENRTYIFPPDLFGFVAIFLWIWDWCGILMGRFKYPVVVRPEAPNGN